ncbi:hypothetical protein [Argonema antarcticum]|uniref:hypothetical protein n=1 Tax=Argonema antarcticum TaxID=2942763 RepID=UPI00201120F3|nr:hypothetical protein [Argonema antarcticum]MCL1472216.1 hypothetical protein [Argonema antarcticum A004/B2]
MNMQWQTYKNLELIPDPVTEPQASNSAFITRLGKGWRSLVDTVVEKFPEQRQIQHLEKCWSFNWTESSSTNRAMIWSTLWLILNQPIFTKGLTTSPEPEIRQLSDRKGHVFWSAYDPLTRQEIFLESEEEVQIWLEERLYR